MTSYSSFYTWNKEAQGPLPTRPETNMYGCLAQGLRDRQMAVLFRNNHFNTIFYHQGAIYILVTDQGYLYEIVRSILPVKVH